MTGWKKKNTRKSRKFFLVMLSAAVFLITASGCRRSDENSKIKQNNLDEGSQKLQIVTTIFPLYDFARQIGGELAEVKMLLPPGMESHSYEPTPQDMIAVMNSDLFYYIGGESDVWVKELLGGVATGRERAYSLIHSVEAVEEQEPEGTSVKGHRHGAEETEYDEHIWTAPENAILMVKAMEAAMCEADPENSKEYRENSSNYIKNLEKLNQDFANCIQEGKRDTLVFGDRFPFRYFADAYGLRCYAAFPGCSSETETSASTMAYLVDKVEQEGIPAVFYLEMSNHRIADAIAETAGVKTLRFHSCHNVTKSEVEQGETYISLMEENLEHLKEALQ